MSLLMWIFMGIVLLGLILFVIGIILDHPVIGMSGIISSIVVGIGGLGAFGNSNILERENIQVKMEVIKSSRAVILDDGKTFYELTDHHSYKNIDINTVFYFNIGYNHYYSTTEKSLHWTNRDGTSSEIILKNDSQN